MSLRRFRYFVDLARDLHVGRVAERAGIAQPALSQQIRLLERELGVRLFRRAGRGIALTEAGAAFLPEALAALAQSERAISVARRTARGELGHIHIGYVATAMLEPEFPALLFAFREAVPDAAVSLAEMSVEDQLQHLRLHWLDVAIVRAPVGSLPADLQIRPFTRRPLLAAVPTRLAGTITPPLDLKHLSAEPFILLRDPSGIGLAHQIWSLCIKAGFTPRVDLRVSNPISIVGLVAAGFGVGLVPAALAQTAIPGVSFLGISEPDGHTDLVMVHRPADSSPLKLRFLDLAESALRRRINETI